MKNKKIYTFMNEKENVNTVATELVGLFSQKADKESVDYAFDIAKGTGKVKVREANTFFSCDTDGKTTLDLFKKILFDDDLKELTKKEEDQLTQDIENFMKKIAEDIIINHSSIIRNKIRDIVLPKSQKKDIPLNEIQILAIDVADFSSIPEPAKYLMRIGKANNSSVETDKVILYIHEMQEETGETAEEIFENEKEQNPLFKNVVSVQTGKKYLFEITMSFFVDYSLSQLPPAFPG